MAKCYEIRGQNHVVPGIPVHWNGNPPYVLVGRPLNANGYYSRAGWRSVKGPAGIAVPLSSPLASHLLSPSANKDQLPNRLYNAQLKRDDYTGEFYLTCEEGQEAAGALVSLAFDNTPDPLHCLLVMGPLTSPRRTELQFNMDLQYGSYFHEQGLFVLSQLEPGDCLKIYRYVRRKSAAHRWWWPRYERTMESLGCVTVDSGGVVRAELAYPAGGGN